MRRATIFMLVFVIAAACLMLGAYSATGQLTGQVRAKVDPKLLTFVNTHVNAKTPVVITYDHRPTATDFGKLQSLGINKGFACQRLPMVIADMNAAQLAGLQTQAGVRSVWVIDPHERTVSICRRGQEPVLLEGGVQLEDLGFSVALSELFRPLGD